MERLSPGARALLDAAQRAEAPSAEFRACFDRNWPRHAARVGIGVAGTLATSLVAKSASGSSAASGAGAVAGGAALSNGLASVAFTGIVGKVAAVVTTAAALGSLSYALWVPPELEESAPVPVPVVQLAESRHREPVVERIVISPPPTVSTASPSGGIPPTSPPSVSPRGARDSSPSRHTSPPPPTPVASAARAEPTVAPRSTLVERVRELQRAHELLRNGAPETALELLEPDAPGEVDALSTEREALRISALCRVANPARRERGRALASAFEQANPSSPMLRRLRHECAR